MASLQGQIDEVVEKLNVLINGKGELSKREELQIGVLQARETGLRAQLAAEAPRGVSDVSCFP